jgi:hypothetical protein
MRRDAPALQHVLLSPQLAASLEAASLAIGRLDARVCATSVVKPWQLRAAWTGYARALQLQGHEIDEVDVFSWGCGVRVPGRVTGDTLADPFADFNPWRAQLALPVGRHWREDLPFEPLADEVFGRAPLLVRALEITRQHAGADLGISAWLALPLLLQRLGATQTPLPCLVVGTGAFRNRSGDPAVVLRQLLRALCDAADAGLASLTSIEADRRRAIHAIRGERRSGSLTELAALSLTAPVLSPQSVGKALGLSLSGAGKLLTRAAQLQLLREVTNRGSWRLYLTPDLAVTLGFMAAPRGRPRAEPPALPHDRDVAAIVDSFDAEMENFVRRFPNLTSTASMGNNDRHPSNGLQSRVSTSD